MLLHIYTRVMIFYLRMPDVGSDELMLKVMNFCMLMTKITFFLVNIKKPRAPMLR